MQTELVDRLMKSAVAEGSFPGAVLLVSSESTVVFLKAYGLAHIYEKVPVTTETIFDLASLTKPLATTLAVMHLVQNRRISVEDSLGDLVPDFQGNAKARVRLKHLLYHNSGLPDYRPYYQKLSKIPMDSRRTALRQFLVAEPLIHPCGEKVLYSDLGFMILAWVVEHITGRRLDQLVADEIYRPLGLRQLFFNAQNAAGLEGSFAATENCPWRREILAGQVHDENAFAVGGVEGHAGLFGTAGDVNTLLIELLRAYQGRITDGVFSRDLLHQFFKRLPQTDKAMGFDMPLFEGASCGRGFSLNSVGHLGFTGTSFWMDLERSTIVVLLTNRVHPTRENELIKAFRPRLHDAVMNTLEE
ncbi:MAG: serine hydrolase [Desulfobacterales bacterium]|jgi:CubicO group peptidase (beta-lactamase class C family)